MIDGLPLILVSEPSYPVIAITEEKVSEQPWRIFGRATGIPTETVEVWVDPNGSAQGSIVDVDSLPTGSKRSL